MDNYIKSAIKSLCAGEGNKLEVRQVVDYFIQRTCKILIHKTGLVNEWKDQKGEIIDLALDFIGPLFARDDHGVFYELKQYFESRFSLSEAAFKQEIMKLLLSVVRQESIRIFALRDPVGKIFYRSLHYLLNKYPRWRKQEHNSTGPVICTQPEAELVGMDTIQTAFQQSKVGILTRDLEQVLIELVENRQKSVSVIDLLAYIRQTEWGHAGLIGPLRTDEDPNLTLSLDQMISAVIRTVEKNIIKRYCEKGKLTPEECDRFKCALGSLMRDYTDGGIHQTYFNYLNHSFNGELTSEKYYQSYRHPFEYIVKNAKKIFSADAKIVFRV
ncbi:MAG: hypothetical protein ACE5D2_05120 [Fidelibacterota bacterium]